jgi:hypothetical protein
LIGCKDEVHRAFSDERARHWADVDLIFAHVWTYIRQASPLRSGMQPEN